MKTNFGATNINHRDYFVTGITVHNGDEANPDRHIHFDDFKDEPMTCPCVVRYGDEREVRVEGKIIPTIERWDTAGKPFVIIYTSCEKLSAADHAVGNQRVEIEAARQV